MQRLDTYCEIDLAEGTEVKGERRTLTLDGQPVSIDICAAHEEQLIEPLRQALAKFGETTDGPVRVAAATPAKKSTVTRPVETKRAAAKREYPCEHPDCAYDPFTHGAARASHYRSAHPNWTPPGKVKGRGKTKSSAKASTSKATSSTRKRRQRTPVAEPVEAS